MDLSSALAPIRRFPYLILGWVLIAAVSFVLPDRMFLTRNEGLWFGIAFLGVALLRGSRQISQNLPVELGLLTLSQLPRKDQMQYLGHGFLWNPQRANQVLAVERDSAVISRSRGPGNLGGVTTLHAV
ncbi:MAG: hypothetical protein DMG97_31025, partial [Acidobacteria bacterium]